MLIYYIIKNKNIQIKIRVGSIPVSQSTHIHSIPLIKDKPYKHIIPSVFAVKLTKITLKALKTLPKYEKYLLYRRHFILLCSWICHVPSDIHFPKLNFSIFFWFCIKNGIANYYETGAFSQKYLTLFVFLLKQDWSFHISRHNILWKLSLNWKIAPKNTIILRCYFKSKLSKFIPIIISN